MCRGGRAHDRTDRGDHQGADPDAAERPRRRHHRQGRASRGGRLRTRHRQLWPGPALRSAGDDVRDPAGIESWFRTWDGPIGYDIGDPFIEVGDDVAFCHGLTHMTGTKTDGEQVDLWFRSTVGLRRTAAGWQITHEHDSTPFYMDGSGLAATDLKP